MHHRINTNTHQQHSAASDTSDAAALNALADRGCARKGSLCEKGEGEGLVCCLYLPVSLILLSPITPPTLCSTHMNHAPHDSDADESLNDLLDSSRKLDEGVSG